jgi:alkylated DNA repair dioxygenase AlkB
MDMTVKKQATKKRAAKKQAAKRELIAPRRDKRYIRRDAKGRIKESVSRIAAGKRIPRPHRDRATAETATHGKRCVPNANPLLDLFGEETFPQGLKYRADFLGPEEEQDLLSHVERLPFREFEFQGFTGRRRIVSFGWRYDFNGGGLTKTQDLPKFLGDLRVRAETFAEIAPNDFQQVLVTEYGPGAGIGWHKDRRYLAMSSVSRFSLPALSGFAGRPAKAGNDTS